MQKENLSTDYPATSQLSDHQVLEQAAEIIANKYLRGDVFSSPEATKEFLTYKLGNYEREVFAILMLDNQHRLIEFKELFLITRE